MLKNAFTICHLVKPAGLLVKSLWAAQMSLPSGHQSPIFSLFVVQQSNDPAHTGVSQAAEKPFSFPLRKGALSPWVYLVQRSTCHKEWWLLLGWDFSHWGAMGAIPSCSAQRACHHQKTFRSLAHLGWISRKTMQP